jgi:hypothetical protein
VILKDFLKTILQETNFKKDIFKFIAASLSYMVAILVFSIIHGNYSWVFENHSTADEFTMFIATYAFFRTYL